MAKGRQKKQKVNIKTPESRNISSDKIEIVYFKAPYTINTKNISEYQLFDRTSCFLDSR